MVRRGIALGVGGIATYALALYAITHPAWLIVVALIAIGAMAYA